MRRRWQGAGGGHVESGLRCSIPPVFSGTFIQSGRRACHVCLCPPAAKEAPFTSPARTFVRKPSSFSGNSRYSASDSTACKMASPRNSNRWLWSEAFERLPGTEGCVTASSNRPTSLNVYPSVCCIASTLPAAVPRSAGGRAAINPAGSVLAARGAAAAAGTGAHSVPTVSRKKSGLPESSAVLAASVLSAATVVSAASPVPFPGQLALPLIAICFLEMDLSSEQHFNNQRLLWQRNIGRSAPVHIQRCVRETICAHSDPL